MDFKKITFSDIQTIKDFFLLHDYGVCDFTIGGLYMWIDYFSYMYAIVDDVLFIKSSNDYALPLGNTKKGIEMLIKENKYLSFNVVPKEALDYFDGYSFQKEELVDWFDYVYFASDLAYLENHRYIKKRDLLHQFINNYDYRYEALSNPKEIVDEYTSFHRNLEDMATYENTKTLEVLNNYEKYPFVGGVLYVNDRIVAFTVGEIMNDCLYVHIEKANVDYKGVYQAINCFFVKEIFEKYGIKYVNREEDVGSIGLRKAKSSYYPCYMKEKYLVKI